MKSMRKWSRKASYRFGFVAFVIAVALSLAVATVAVAYLDEFGGGATFAPYTTTDGTGRALGYWDAYEKAVAAVRAVHREVRRNRRTSRRTCLRTRSSKPFAPYTEKYAATDNIAPHVPSDLDREAVRAVHREPSRSGVSTLSLTTQR